MIEFGSYDKKDSKSANFESSPPAPWGQWDFDPSRLESTAAAVRVEMAAHTDELPVHSHAAGQLVFTLRGSVSCEVPSGVWMVPPHSGVWIPRGLPHSNRVSANGVICFLFVAPGAALLPEQCCTLGVSPLLRELILRLASLPRPYKSESSTARLVSVLLEELAQMRTENYHLPLSDDYRLRRLARWLMESPADRSTAAEWAARSALSERTLFRLVERETGMTFGRWRQQLQLLLAIQKLAAGTPVHHVAQDLGYDSVSAFITMFKRMLGKPPARYLADLKRAMGGAWG